MEDDEDLLEGETVEIDSDEDDVEDLPDGGAIVRLDEENPKAGESEFYANLAETMPEGEMATLASRLLDLISKDKDARKKRDEQYEDGLRRTGLGDDAPGGAEFQGASKVVHPMMTEACVDFAARAIKELWPANGPVKDKVEGETTAEKVDKAKRKTDLMNWQLTVQAEEARAEVEQMLTQVPLGGAQYLKCGWDEARNRPTFLFVAIDDMYLPFAATNFYSSQRKTHVQYLTQLDYDQRVRSGMYRDVDLAPVTAEPEMSVAATANDKIEGREASSYNEDGLRIVYEIHGMFEIEGDDEGALPYIVSVDKPSGKVLAIYRNWEEDDDTRTELQWFVEFPFVPWRGAYPIGFPQMIGGLSGAATGALRALLDSAHISNSATMLKLKGGVNGQSVNIQPTQVAEVEGNAFVDDVRKLAMPLPFNPPSPVLFQLLGFLVDAGKGVVRTTLDDVADSNPNAPVGTTLAKLEQGMVLFSAIHARLHNAMGRMLRILHRLNGMYLDDDRLKDEVGEELASREDFEGPMDVVPVSDPNIFSEAQRYAQVQAVAQRAMGNPLYNPRKVEERILETLKIPDYEALLMPAQEPEKQNAVAENAAASLGRPIAAFPAQDHIAHLKTHLAFLTNPMFGSSELFAPSFMPAIIGHLKEHIAYWYMSSTIDLAEDAAGEDLKELSQRHASDDDSRAMDRLLAEASLIVVARGQEVFASLPPVIAQAQQMAQQFAPPQPMDPSMVKAQEVQQRGQMEQAKLQMQGQQAQQQAQTEQAKLQLEAQKMAQADQTEQRRAMLQQMLAELDAQAEQARQQAETDRVMLQQSREDARTNLEVSARMTMNEADNRTAMELAQLEAITGERVAVSTGTGINPQP